MHLHKPRHERVYTATYKKRKDTSLLIAIYLMSSDHKIKGPLCMKLRRGIISNVQGQPLSRYTTMSYFFHIDKSNISSKIPICSLHKINQNQPWSL